MSDLREQYLNNYIALAALAQVDEELAIKLISDPELDSAELSKLIEFGIMGKAVDKKTGEPLKVGNNVLMAGVRNRMNQIIRDNKAT